MDSGWIDVGSDFHTRRGNFEGEEGLHYTSLEHSYVQRDVDIGVLSVCLSVHVFITL